MDKEQKKLKTIGGQTVVDQIIESLTDAIVQGEYRAGMKLPSEFELMADLQVSRNSLREAMKILAAMGIVEIRRGDGTYVCSQVNPSLFDRVIYSLIYDASSSEELLELRQVLDEATVRLAMARITPEEILGLQENIDAMRAAWERGDADAMAALDMEFHRLLMESCKNVFFVRIMKGVYTIFENSIGENIRQEATDSKAPMYHQAILDCIVAGDDGRVPQVVAQSLDTWRKRV